MTRKTQESFVEDSHNQIGKLNQKIIDEADNVEQTENVSE